jgi:isopenicillin N synthase-like dioxygenase
MLEAWSNGIFRSTPHRVVNRSPERFSMPYFVAANHDTIIRPFPELVPTGELPRYQPFLAGEHLERMLIRDFPYLRDRQKRRQMTQGARVSTKVVNPFETRIQVHAQ